MAPTTTSAFWTDLKARRLKLDVIQSKSPQPGVQQVVFQAEVQSGAGSTAQTVYVTDGQLWQQQGGQWRLVATKRGEVTRLKQPTSLNKVIYPPALDAHAEIKHALRRRRKPTNV